MADSITIRKHTGTAGESRFDRLRAEGMARVQELSRNQWTDYNEHDPGVTILEAFCYALTDVMYRADFPVADLLVNEEGAIDWRRQALLPAEEVLPCRPTTELDYRAAILDQVKDVENVRLEAVIENGNPTGLYRVLLRLRPHTGGLGTMGPSLKSQEEEERNLLHRKDRVLREVRAVFSETRSLCEDIESIELFTAVEFELHANVEIAPGIDPAGVLASVYQKCSEYLSAGLEFQPYELALQEGKSPEEIFCGPFTHAGMVIDSVRKSRTSFSTTEAYALIKSVTGVQSVTFPDSFTTVKSDGPLQLHWPTSKDQIGVKILRNGTPVAISIRELNMRFQELNFANRGLRLGSHAAEEVVAKPVGKLRNLRGYQSIQNELPPVYGVGPRGMPDSASQHRKVSAHQLRGYLLLLDQHLADLLQTLARLRDLYSIDLSRFKTRFFQVLDESSFPGICEVLDRGVEAAMERMCRSERNTGRADKVLDYLLALYGEVFSCDSRLPSYGVDRKAVEEQAFLARKNFLENVVPMTRDRGAGRDYLQAAGRDENPAGLEARLNHFLEFAGAKNSQDQIGVRVVEHILLRPPVDHFHITVLFPGWGEVCKDPGFRMLAAETVEAHCPAHVYAEIRWLNRDEMMGFNELHERWLEHVHDGHASTHRRSMSPRGRDEEGRDRSAEKSESGPGIHPGGIPDMHGRDSPLDEARAMDGHAAALRDFLKQLGTEGAHG